MKITSIILAAGLLAVPGIALAQSAPQTASSPGKESTAAPTDKVQPPGNIRAKQPARDSMATMKMKKTHRTAKRKVRHMTTGSSKPTAVPLDSASGTGKKP